MNYNLITILGPTAVGKTRLGALLAYKFGGEIISADSRQVYKGMDIGTGKDLSDYVVEGQSIEYYLIDVLNPDEEFNLFTFNKMFFESYDNIVSKNKIPFLVGGTGMYLHSVLKDYDLKEVEFNDDRYETLNKMEIDELREYLKSISSNLHNTTDLLIKDRIIKAIIVAEKNETNDEVSKHKIKSLTIGVDVDRETVKKRIADRLKNRLDNGMIEEVKGLLEKGISFEKLEFFGLEYKFIARYLKNEFTRDELFEKLNIAIRQFAKRQMTWYRKMEKEGINIHWIAGSDYNAAEKLIIENYPV